jgi:hypothetical protein
VVFSWKRNREARIASLWGLRFVVDQIRSAAAVGGAVENPASNGEAYVAGVSGRLIVVIPTPCLYFLEHVRAGEVVEELLDEIVIDIGIKRVAGEGVAEVGQDLVGRAWW